jgi:type IV pilus assembly protein PilE
MKTLQRKRILGFTIIELMIVVMIVAILLAIAYPSYVQYVRKAKRGDAQQLLMNWSINQEIWRSNNTTYNNADDLKPSHDNYAFVVTLPVGQEGTSYTLTATASGDQENDEARDGTPCKILNLRSDGRKYSGNDDTVLVCWK